MLRASGLQPEHLQVGDEVARALIGAVIEQAAALCTEIEMKAGRRRRRERSGRT
jgi:hypothetical protein